MPSTPRRLLIGFASSALGACLAIIFLAPAGERIAFSALSMGLLGGAAAAAAYSYARLASEQTPRRNESLAFAVDVCEVTDEFVPRSALRGESPVVAIVNREHVPHPKFIEHLLPYFIEPSLGFVQAAMRYDGEGGVSDAFRAHEALGDSWAQARSRVGATLLRGSGALIARDCLTEAYYPGITFEELGMRIEALGYTAHFETKPLMLAWAAHDIEAYWPTLVARGYRALRLVPHALMMRGLSFEARLQYLAHAALYMGVLGGAAVLALSPIAVLTRGVGPLLFSPAAVVPLLLFVLSAGTTLYYARRLNLALAQSLALALIGAEVAGYRYAERAWHSEPVQRLLGQALALARAARSGVATSLETAAEVATAPIDGSAGTAPAGTPAHS